MNPNIDSRLTKQFITSAPIDYIIPPYDMYDSFDLVSRGELNAPLSSLAEKIVKEYNFPFTIKDVKKIYCAHSGQTRDTAQLITQHRAPEATIVPIAELQNIIFSMHDLVPKETFLKMPPAQALNMARREFIIRITTNSLQESVTELQLRMDHLIKIAINSNEFCLYIGHSFFLRLLQLHMRDPNIISHQDRLLTQFQPDRKPFDPLEGFALDC